jgi:hypothetical protein
VYLLGVKPGSFKLIVISPADSEADSKEQSIEASDRLLMSNKRGRVTRKKIALESESGRRST